MNQIRYFIVTMRPQQWTKNLLVFAALIFSGNLLDYHLVLRSIAVFGMFCLLSGSVYVVNDIMDRQGDQNHPEKKLRPIAAGGLNIVFAVVLAGILAISTLVLALWMSWSLFLVFSA